MNHSVKIGFSFGLTSGVITTLGLIVGLNAGTHSAEVVIGGILTIAIADAFSDALGIHISEESENIHTGREIWTSTVSTFLTKFLIAVSFSLPVFIFSLKTAIILNLIWGYLLMIGVSYYVAEKGTKKPWKVIREHILITTLVIILSDQTGKWIAKHFN